MVDIIVDWFISAVASDLPAVAHNHHTVAGSSISLNLDEMNTTAIPFPPASRPASEFRLRSDIDTSGWFVKNREIGICQKPSSDNHLLLVSARQRFNRSLAAGMS